MTVRMLHGLDMHMLCVCMACAWCVHVARLVAEQEEPDCVGREEADDGQADRGELGAREAARQRLACAKRLAWHACMGWVPNLTRARHALGMCVHGMPCGRSAAWRVRASATCQIQKIPSRR